MSRGRLLDLLLQPGSLRAVFQPVVNLAAGQRVHYLEGLIRGPHGTNVERPEVLFDYARRKRAEVEVDRACLRTVLEAARLLPDAHVGVNLHSATLAGDLELLNYFGDLLSHTGIAPERVIVELVEHSQPWDEESLLLNLEGLRGIGVRVALDDFGTAHANYRMLLEARPDYLKIDSYFVQDVQHDARRQAVLESLAGLADRIGMRVIAEGVEQPGDLARLHAAGVDLAQGHLLGMPGPAAGWRPSGGC